MDEQVKNCGNCRWWECEPEYTNGDCKFPLPICVGEEWRAGTDEYDGTDCPCFEPKREE